MFHAHLESSGNCRLASGDVLGPISGVDAAVDASSANLFYCVRLSMHGWMCAVAWAIRTCHEGKGFESTSIPVITTPISFPTDFGHAAQKLT